MRVKNLLCLAVLTIFTASVAHAITIETVPVGNPGNANDTHGDGYGGVTYEYNIGKYEVTAGQYHDFLNAVAKTDTYGLYCADMNDRDDGCQITRTGNSGNYIYDFSGRPSGDESDWVNRPVNFVNWGDAARFANWLHNGQPTGEQDTTTTEDGAYCLSNTVLMDVRRKDDWKWAIPTEDEWCKAAYYDSTLAAYFNYPARSDSVPSNNLTDPDPGNNANFDYTIGADYYRTEVGAFALSESPYGTFDQGGNVWEWNEAILDYGNLFRGLRGGSFCNNNTYLHASDRYYYAPSTELRHVGFRVVVASSVAAIPEPGSITLLVCGVVILLIWWRRREVVGVWLV